MIYSLNDLRGELSIELRNEAGTGARYSEEEMDICIRRATNMLSEYFWYTEEDSSKTFVDDQYTYVYDYPIRNFQSVAFKAGNDGVYQYSDSWYEPIDGSLVFTSDHVAGETIYIWYERHPVPYPHDLTTVSGTIGASDTTITVDGGVPLVSWPSTGYFKLGDEIIKYTGRDPATNTLTVERGTHDSAATSHAGGSSLSFVNLVDKPVFFEGVKDLAMAYLNRLRIVDIPAADAQGNVTIMREILGEYRNWIRTHRMRSKRPVFTRTNTTQGFRTRRRGR